MALPKHSRFPRLPQRRREQETHRSNERILSDLGPACAAGTAGLETPEEDKLRAEHKAGQGEVRNSPASPCFRWLISGVTSEQQFITEAQKLPDLPIKNKSQAFCFLTKFLGGSVHLW